MCIKFRCCRDRLVNKITYKDSTDDLSLNASAESLLETFQRTRSMRIIRNNSKKDLRMGFGNDLILFLILSNLGYSVSTFLTKEQNTNHDTPISTLCITQGFLQNFFDMSSICWNAIISRVIVLGIKIDMKMIKRRLIGYFIYANIFPLVFSLGYVYIYNY